jgi:membrane-associated phospholipid phosphatase
MPLGVGKGDNAACNRRKPPPATFTRAPSTLPELWYRLLLRITTRIYYRRVRVVHLAPLEIGNRPVLFLGLHRNGAVDGMLYKSVFPAAVFLIARRLLRSAFTRLYFTGIPVTREHDDDVLSRRENPRSLTAAVDHLVSGGQLFILPEGTSDLGPRHLPFKPGAAKVLDAARQRGVTPLVVPVGIFYESAPSFRSDVCIVVGPPIDVTVSRSLDHRSERIAELMSRITTSLEAIAVEAEDAATLRRIEVLSALAVEEHGENRWRVQKMLTAMSGFAVTSGVRKAVGPTPAAATNAINGAAVDRAGVPRFSKHGPLWNGMWLALQLPIVAAAVALNLVPVVGAWLAGRRLADARNTIALWRILVGTPLTLLWVVAVAMAGVVLHRPWIPMAYAAVTVLGLVTYPELCIRWPKFLNSCRSIPPILPHEYAFFALYAVVIVRLLLVRPVAWAELSVWLAFAVTSAALVLLTRRRDGIGTWRLRLGAYVLLMNAAYFSLGAVFTASGDVRRDALLQRADTLLFGRPAPLYFDGVVGSGIADLLSFCYFLLFPYILISCARQLVRLRRSPRETRAFYSGLFVVYAIGFLGYLFVPAQGAWLDMPAAFQHPIAGGWMTAFNQRVVAQGSNRVDVFPSLHVAVSAFILFFDRRFALWRFRVYLPAAVGLWISTLYLRFHYGVDVLAGALLAMIGVRVAFAMAGRPVPWQGEWS